MNFGKRLELLEDKSDQELLLSKDQIQHQYLIKINR